MPRRAFPEPAPSFEFFSAQSTEENAQRTDNEALPVALEHNADYRILRRVISRDHFPEPVGETKIGIILDTETTGLDPRTDTVIELAMLSFEYHARGQVCRVLNRFQSFNDPGQPISAEITRLTGITDEMVTGQTIDLGVVER